MVCNSPGCTLSAVDLGEISLKGMGGSLNIFQVSKAESHLSMRSYPVATRTPDSTTSEEDVLGAETQGATLMRRQSLIGLSALPTAKGPTKANGKFARGRGRPKLPSLEESRGSLSSLIGLSRRNVSETASTSSRAATWLGQGNAPRNNPKTNRVAPAVEHS
mmetsp:Transcript_45217/g.117133  ORF Transcript_45217/g.117133 Transcript_45217/m.117133 type:complete len:162 (+) Transcript_45217:131-616(+)